MTSKRYLDPFDPRYSDSTERLASLTVYLIECKDSDGWYTIESGLQRTEAWHLFARLSGSHPAGPMRIRCSKPAYEYNG